MYLDCVSFAETQVRARDIIEGNRTGSEEGCGNVNDDGSRFSGFLMDDTETVTVKDAEAACILFMDKRTTAGNIDTLY
jgi:hypothetical protein